MKDRIIQTMCELRAYALGKGIAAASRGLLRKEPHGLDDADAWLLAALIPSPNAQAEKVAQRACALARSMKAANAPPNGTGAEGTRTPR